MKLNTQNYQLKTNQRAFTLIELVVTMGIMALITSVTLANHTKFGGQVVLRNLAYELALIVREAQTYGVSVRKISIGSGEFESGYGIHFNANNPNEYVMFADTHIDGGNRGEDGMRNTVLEDVNTYTIGKGYKLSKICAGGSTPTCIDVCSGGACSGSLDILFKRPEPDAAIRFNGVSNILYERAEIELISPRDDTMKVLIEVSGQISVIK